MLCGIDEAGRGPLAGDLVIAGCLLHTKIDGLNDSKQLSAKKRERLYEIIIQNSTYYIAKFSASQIDTLGISECLHLGLVQIMQKVKAKHYLFDGNSNFGVAGLQTLIKADTTVAAVSAASILAKVAHDRDMIELDKIYPEYGFASHKGYGTAAHIEKIKKYGYCDIHRRSYKIKALEPTLF